MTAFENPDKNERSIFFASASLLRLVVTRKTGIAECETIIRDKQLAEMGWREPDPGEVCQKNTRLDARRIEFRQNVDEIGKYRIEADIEVTSVENISLARRAEPSGRFVTRMKFILRFACVDGAENLEPFLKRTERPGTLRIYYVPPTPKPKQAELPLEDQPKLELVEKS